MDVFGLSPVTGFVSPAAGQMRTRIMQQFVVFDENGLLLPFAYSLVVQVTCMNKPMVFYETGWEGVGRIRLVAGKMVDFFANFFKKRGKKQQSPRGC